MFKFTSLVGIALLSLALPYTLASSHGAVPHRRHEAIAAAQHNATEVAGNVLHRRGNTYKGARLTYYDVGLGACGDVNVPSDYIVALNSGMYGGGYPGPNCNRPILITYKDKSAKAIIKDECPGCPSDGGLDLSEGLFSALAPLDDGVIYADWYFLDEGDNEPPAKPTTTKKPWTPLTTEWKPEPTTTTKRKTTTTHHEEPTTSAEPSSTKPEPTSTSSSSSTKPSSTSHSTSSSSSFSSSSSSSSSTAAPTPTGPNTLGKLNQAFLGLNELIIAGAQAS